MSWTQPAFERLANLVNQRTGLAFVNRNDSAELSMRRAMTRSAVADPAHYFDLVAADDRLLDDLVSELTVGETYFFREPGQFRRLRSEVLPEIRRRRGPGHVVRTWSAGCASGEEAYSLAMVLEEEGLGEQGHVLGTDISHKALAKARCADFGEWSLRGENGKAALPYLTSSRGRYALHERIRRRVTFAYLNLAMDAYPSFATGVWGMDLILCRNVLIYFDRDTIHKVAQRLFQTLAEGGWLITASSDPPLWEEAPFTVVSSGDGLIYRRSTPQKSAGVGATDENVFGLGDVSAALPIESGKDEAARSAEVPLSFWTEYPATPVSAAAIIDPMEEARQALAHGDYGRTIQLTRDLADDPAAAALHVRALANQDPAAAGQAGALAAARFPLSAELNFLQAVLLLDLGQNEEALKTMRRVLYLDRALAIAHFTLGNMLCRAGDLPGACRAYRNARDLCAARAADEIVPLADGVCAGRLAEVAAAELAFLETSQAREP